MPKRNKADNRKQKRARKAETEKLLAPFGRCISCTAPLGMPGGCGDTDLCGPCCHGEESMVMEKWVSW